MVALLVMIVASLLWPSWISSSMAFRPIPSSHPLLRSQQEQPSTTPSSRTTKKIITTASLEQLGFVQESIREERLESCDSIDNDDDCRTPVNIIIAGAPASGKGTQCEVIANEFGVVHLSTGDMLRTAILKNTDIGRKAKEYMDAGRLVPDDIMIDIILDRISDADCQQRGWLLDGFPRTAAQAKALKTEGITVDCFVFLDVPDEVIVERVIGRRTDPETGKIYHTKFSPPPINDKKILSRLVQRSDDTEEKIIVRLEQFHSNIASVKKIYNDEIMITIDGNRSPSDVSKDVIESIQCAITLTP